MKISQRSVEDVVVLEIQGNIMGGPDAQAFKDTITGLLEQGTRKVLVDLERVRRINSTGLGILIAGYTSLKNQGGEMKLACLSSSVTGVLVMTQLDKVFDTYRTVEGALAVFKRAN